MWRIQESTKLTHVFHSTLKAGWTDNSLFCTVSTLLPTLMTYVYTFHVHLFLPQNRCTQAECYTCHLRCMKQTQSKPPRLPGNAPMDVSGLCAPLCTRGTVQPKARRRSWPSERAGCVVPRHATPPSSRALPPLLRLVCASKRRCAVSLRLFFLLISELIKYLQVS